MNTIKNISFLNAIQSDERDKQHMDYWKKNGFDLSKIVEQIRNEGEEAKESNYAWAHNMSLNAHHIATNQTLTHEQLQEAHVDILNKIKRLYDIINGSMDYDPDKASFASVIKVTESNGKEYIINADVEDKIIKKFNSTILSLQQAIVVIEAKLNGLKKESKEGIKENLFSLETAFEKMLFLKYSGILESLGNSFTKPDGSPNQVKIAKIIAYLTNETASNINTHLPYLFDHTKIGSGHNALYSEKSLEKAIQALSDSRLDTTEPQQKLLDIEKNLKN